MSQFIRFVPLFFEMQGVWLNIIFSKVLSKSNGIASLERKIYLEQCFSIQVVVVGWQEG